MYFLSPRSSPPNLWPPQPNQGSSPVRLTELAYSLVIYRVLAPQILVGGTSVCSWRWAVLGTMVVCKDFIYRQEDAHSNFFPSDSFS